MKNTSEISKLEELRAKTDRELCTLIRKDLDRALTLARVAAGRGSAMHIEAEAAYAEVTMLLPGLAGVSREARERLESRVKELRRELDSAPRAPNPAVAQPGVGLRSFAQRTGSV
jgi:hypothetical protein